MLHSLPLPPSFRSGEVRSNFTQVPQRNIDSSLVVLGQPTVFFFRFALARKAGLEVFPEPFSLLVKPSKLRSFSLEKLGL